MRKLRLAFAGDRDISVSVLRFIISEGVNPVALLLPEQSRASHAEELRTMCSFLSQEQIFIGRDFREPRGVEAIRALNLDYIIGIHFPYIVPAPVLEVSGRGFLNLHPSFLPYNRGWHTPSWAILDGTPIGATLHFMDTQLDTGDIVCQERVQVEDSDTADALYKKLKAAELQVFKRAWPSLVSGTYPRVPQVAAAGTVHRRHQLFSPEIQKIDLDRPTSAGELLSRLRALTTNQIEEAAYFESNGKRHRVQVVITTEDIEEKK